MNALIFLSIAGFVLSCFAAWLMLVLTHSNNQPAEEPEVTR